MNLENDVTPSRFKSNHRKVLLDMRRTSNESMFPKNKSALNGPKLIIQHAIIDVATTKPKFIEIFGNLG